MQHSIFPSRRLHRSIYFYFEITTNSDPCRNQIDQSHVWIQFLNDVIISQEDYVDISTRGRHYFPYRSALVSTGTDLFGGKGNLRIVRYVKISGLVWELEPSIAEVSQLLFLFQELIHHSQFHDTLWWPLPISKGKALGTRLVLT